MVHPDWLFQASEGRYTVYVALLGVIIVASPVSAYRPFVSTDADVAQLHQVEIEMGYFNFARQNNQTTWTTPLTVLNYGFREGFEAVGQFELDKTSGMSTQVADPELSVKAVAKKGILQDKPGGSLAFETVLLLPSTYTGQDHFGFQETGIWSQGVGPMIFHFNLGPGIDRVGAAGFIAWGVIAELPLTNKLRLVGEINGQAEQMHDGDSSGLTGLIWESPLKDLFLDAGYRRGLSQAEADWQWTTGFSYGFPWP
jgi:hypothetical protein